MQKICCFILCFICAARQAPAQPVKQYNFTHYSTSAGLLSNQVNTVVQDAQGYIWIGTTDGLQRFDGIRYKTFKAVPNDPTSIPVNPVLQLLIDKKKNLWVLTNDGRVGIFDTRTFTYRQVPVRSVTETVLKYASKKLSTDEEGNIFYQITNDLVTWNEQRNEFSKAHNIFLLPRDGVASFTHQHGTQKYWMTVKNGYIAVFNKATGHLNYPGHNPDREKLVDRTQSFKSPYNFFFDKKNRLWFQTWGTSFPSVYCYDLDKNELVLNAYNFTDELRSYYETSDFFEQSDGTIWVTGLGIFASYREEAKQFRSVYNGYRNEGSIQFEKINALFEDREKNIWTATSNNGLYRFNPGDEYFTNVSHLHKITGRTGNGDVMSFIETKWNTILTGAWGDGIYQYDKDFNPLPLSISGIDKNNGISAWCMIASGDSNTIWISAQPGLYAIDQRNRSARFFNPPQLEQRTIRQVAEDKKGNLWLGMQKFGVFKWSPAKGKKNFNEGLERVSSIPASEHISTVICDRKGLIWIGTSGNGAYVIDPATDSVLLHFQNNHTGATRLPEEGISTIYEYDDSTMILTTSTRILVYNRTRKSSTFLGTPQIISGYIASVKKDKSGYLWISTTTGIYRVSVKNRVFVFFNRVDGIENDKFILASSAALRDGRLLFGSSNQFIVFDPARIRINNNYPEVTITGIEVSNKAMNADSLLQLKKIVLGPSANNLVIEFSSLNFSSQFLIKYKLEGMDKDWKLSDKNNKAIYSYLPPGTYTFLAKTLDAEGMEGTKVTRFVIRLKPHFWKTWWFYSLCVIVLAVAVFLVDRERMQRKESIRLMRNDIAGNLHTEVNAALNNINLLSEMARIKAGTDPQKSKEYIEQIHTKSQNMIIAMDDMLWTLDEGNDSIEKTLDRMREYIDALINRHGVAIDLKVDERMHQLKLPMKLRYESFLMFKGGLKNLIATGAKNLKVQIGHEKDKLRFTIQFDNKDCDMQQLNNLLHRQDLETRLKTMNARINIEVHKTRSVIFLQIPVN